MSVQVESTTDLKESAHTSLGGLDKKSKKVESKSASSDSDSELQDEMTEESETSEVENSESNDQLESESEKEELDSKEDEKRPKKKGGFQKRIERFQKKLSDKEQELEYWKKEALKNKDVSSKAEPKALEKTEPATKPKSDDFDSHEAYVEALTEWKLEAKEKEREAKNKEAQVKAEFQKKSESFQEKLSEFKEATEDFDEAMEDVDDVDVNLHLQEMFISSDFGPQLMYELAKDRKELERINSLSPLAAAREIGKIEARILKNSDSSKETEKKQTKAPPPIAPVGSKGSVRNAKSPEEMSYTEYAAWRRRK